MTGKQGAELQVIMQKKSKAAAGLFGWCDAINKCYDIYKVVEPKRQNAKRMQEESAKK